MFSRDGQGAQPSGRGYKNPGQLKIIELAFFGTSEEGAPLFPGEDEHRSGPVVLGVPEADVIRRQSAHLNAASVQVAEGALLP